MKLMESKKDMKFKESAKVTKDTTKCSTKKEEFSMFFKKRKTPSTKC
jgi:hypothetical protein